MAGGGGEATVGGKGSEEGRERPERHAGRSPRPDKCRRYARKELAANLPQILSCFLQEARKGSIPHTKALMSMAGLDKEGALPPMKRKQRQQAGGGLSELLLKELRRSPRSVEAPGKAQKVTDDTPDRGDVYG